MCVFVHRTGGSRARAEGKGSPRGWCSRGVRGFLWVSEVVVVCGGSASPPPLGLDTGPDSLDRGWQSSVGIGHGGQPCSAFRVLPIDKRLSVVV